MLIHGFCNSEMREQHAAAGSPDALNEPNQYSFPGKLQTHTGTHTKWVTAQYSQVYLLVYLLPSHAY
jgi:hypothetical protein